MLDVSGPPKASTPPDLKDAKVLLDGVEQTSRASLNAMSKIFSRIRAGTPYPKLRDSKSVEGTRLAPKAAHTH